MRDTRFRPVPTLLLAAAVAGTAAAAPPPRFPEDAVWHTDVRHHPVHPQSGAMITAWDGLGGFGLGRMQIDFSFHVVHAPADAPRRTIVGYPGTGDYYVPDCEPVGSSLPVPAWAAIEGREGLACDNAGEDCHLLVVQGDRLYEAYRANALGGDRLQSQCLVVWKLGKVYPVDNRGEHCTSADAAGFPIAPLLFNADEVWAAMQQAEGELGHAIRFILPNPRMASTVVGGQRRGQYVRPASHAGGPSGPEDTLPYGSRLRLKADFPVSLYPPAAQVILRTMQHHGIVLADGGNIALTAESDRFTEHGWAELGLNSRTFDQAVPSRPLRPTDFEVIDTGPRILETWDCERTDGTSPPSALVADLVDRDKRVALRWDGGAVADVEIRHGAQTVATVDNVNRWRGTFPGDAAVPWRVCNAGTATCSAPAWPAAPARTLPRVAPPRR